MNLVNLCFCYNNVSNVDLAKMAVSNVNLMGLFLYIDHEEGLSGFEILNQLEKLYLVQIKNPYNVVDWSPLDFFDNVKGRPDSWVRG